VVHEVFVFADAEKRHALFQQAKGLVEVGVVQVVLGVAEQYAIWAVAAQLKKLLFEVWMKNAKGPHLLVKQIVFGRLWSAKKFGFLDPQSHLF